MHHYLNVFLRALVCLLRTHLCHSCYSIILVAAVRKYFLVTKVKKVVYMVLVQHPLFHMTSVTARLDLLGPFSNT